MPILLLLTMTAGCATKASIAPVDARDGIVRVASFNLQYITPTGPRFDRWIRRRDAAIEAIEELDADIVSLQEVETFIGPFARGNLQLDWLKDNLPAYAVAAIGDVSRYPSTQPILYRRDRFEAIDQGFYVYSDQPDVAYSRTFNGSVSSFTSWVTFRDRRSRAVLHVHNMHFDFASGLNRLKSAELTVAKVRPLVQRGERVILAGDINAIRASHTAAILRSIPVTFAPVTGPTFHFGVGIGLFPAIDQLAFSRGFKAAGPPLVLRRSYDGVLPSDHYPVAMDFRLVEAGRREE